MAEYRYKLKNVRPTMRCPQCGRKSFSPYVDTQSGEILGEAIGMCSHKVSCGYHRPPTKDDIGGNAHISQYIKDIDTRQPYLLEPSVYEGLKSNTLVDNFSVNLRGFFSNADEVLKKYGVVCGSIGRKYVNFTGFPYIQQDGTLKSVKMMMYREDLHRAKDEEGNGIVNWLHYFQGFDKTKQKFDACWFGEQLIDSKEYTYDYIGVVESEKTAIIATCCVPNVLWLACGSIGNKKQIIGKGLKTKKVVFFPDANGFENWREWVMAQRCATWKVSSLPKSLSGGDDIADVLLKDADYGQVILEDIQKLFGELIDKDALRYYNSLTATFTDDDWNGIFERYEMPFVCESEMEKGSDGKLSESIKFFKKNDSRKPLEFLQVFTGQFLDDFCAEYHFPKWDDLKKERFSLNFTPEMLTDFLKTYPESFFSGFTFNVDEMSFTHNGRPYELMSFLGERLKNIEASSMNKKVKIKLFKKHENTLRGFFYDFEFADKIDFPRKSLGLYEQVMQDGINFCQNNGFAFSSENNADWQKWMSFFSILWKIDNKSMMSLMLFTIYNQQCRLNYNTSNLRLLNVIGDGGIGKDTTLISLIIGCWRQTHSHRIWEGSTFGATGFTTETPEKVNTYLLQVISDDLKAINDSATFDQISNPLMRIENKGQQPIRVRRRFMQVNTNNNSRFSFSKLDKSTLDAFARRMLVFDIGTRSDSDDQLGEYKRVFAFFGNPEHQTFFAGWWYWCWVMGKNKEFVRQCDNLLYTEVRKNAQDYTYLNKEDDIIATAFERLAKESDFDCDFSQHSIIRATIRSNTYIMVKNFDQLFEDLKQKYGKKTIQASLANTFKNVQQDVVFRPKSSTRTFRCAMAIPIESLDDCSRQNDYIPTPDIPISDIFADSEWDDFSFTEENAAEIISDQKDSTPALDIVAELEAKIVF